MGGGLPECIELVDAACDVISLEHRNCLVTADAHRDRLSDSGPNHIPDCGSSEVMKELARYLRFGARALPQFPEVNDWLSFTVEDEF